MHIYERKIWKLVPQFFICPGKKAQFSLLLASPCEKHRVGGAPVLLVSGRLEMFLNVHTIVLHRSESFTKVEQTKPHREVNRKPLWNLETSLHSSNMFGWLANVGILINSLCYWAAGLSIPCCTPAVTESLSCSSFWFWFGKLLVWFWLRWLSPRSISLPTRAELSSAI